MINFFKKNANLLIVFLASWVSLTIVLMVIDANSDDMTKREYNFSLWQLVEVERTSYNPKM